MGLDGARDDGVSPGQALVAAGVVGALAFGAMNAVPGKAPDDTLGRARLNAIELTMPAAARPAPELALAEQAGALKASPAGQAALVDAAEEGLSIALDRQGDQPIYADPGHRLIGLSDSADLRDGARRFGAAVLNAVVPSAEAAEPAPAPRVDLSGDADDILGRVPADKMVSMREFLDAFQKGLEGKARRSFDGNQDMVMEKVQGALKDGRLKPMSEGGVKPGVLSKERIGMADIRGAEADLYFNARDIIKVARDEGLASTEGGLVKMFVGDLYTPFARTIASLTDHKGLDLSPATGAAPAAPKARPAPARPGV